MEPENIMVQESLPQCVAPQDLMLNLKMASEGREAFPATESIDSQPRQSSPPRLLALHLDSSDQNSASSVPKTGEETMETIIRSQNHHNPGKRKASDINMLIPCHAVKSETDDSSIPAIIDMNVSKMLQEQTARPKDRPTHGLDNRCAASGERRILVCSIAPLDSDHVEPSREVNEDAAATLFANTCTPGEQNMLPNDSTGLHDAANVAQHPNKNPSSESFSDDDDGDDVQFVFSAPRRKRKRRRKLGPENDIGLVIQSPLENMVSADTTHNVSPVSGPHGIQNGFVAQLISSAHTSPRITHPSKNIQTVIPFRATEPATKPVVGTDLTIKAQAKIQATKKYQQTSPRETFTPIPLATRQPAHTNSSVQCFGPTSIDPEALPGMNHARDASAIERHPKTVTRPVINEGIPPTQPISNDYGIYNRAPMLSSMMQATPHPWGVSGHHLIPNNNLGQISSSRSAEFPPSFPRSHTSQPGFYYAMPNSLSVTSSSSNPTTRYPTSPNLWHHRYQELTSPQQLQQPVQQLRQQEMHQLRQQEIQKRLQGIVLKPKSNQIPRPRMASSQAQYHVPQWPALPSSQFKPNQPPTLSQAPNAPPINFTATSTGRFLYSIPPWPQANSSTTTAEIPISRQSHPSPRNSTVPAPSSPIAPPSPTTTLPHPPNMIVDIAQTCQANFPFAAIAERHNQPLQKVFDTFSAIIQLPLLKCAVDKRRAGRLASERMREFREVKRRVAEEKEMRGEVEGERRGRGRGRGRGRAKGRGRV